MRWHAGTLAGAATPTRDGSILRGRPGIESRISSGFAGQFSVVTDVRDAGLRGSARQAIRDKMR